MTQYRFYYFSAKQDDVTSVDVWGTSLQDAINKFRQIFPSQEILHVDQRHMTWHGKETWHPAIIQ